MPTQKSFVLVASISFYQELITIKNHFQAQDYHVYYPDLAKKMEKENDYDVKNHLKSFYGKNPVKNRSKAIKKCLAYIPKADAMLVVNLKKHGQDGYIGGNVLIEMGLAFHHDIPIYLLRPYSLKSLFKDELEAIFPKIIKNDLNKIKI